jgi:hypothetical protein
VTDPRRIQVGDRVRVLDTLYTRTHSDPICWSIGKSGVVTEIHDYSSSAEVVGFDAIYEVEIRPYTVLLIDADLELVERPARIV